MKLREWMKQTAPVGDYRIPAVLLDAEVIGLCPTCGGSEKCPKCGGRGTLQVPRWSEAPEREFGPAIPCGECSGTGVCPDCADAPVWVIAPEAWEAGLAVMLEQTREELADEVMHRDEDSGLTITFGQEEADATFDYNADILRRALQVLLPGARVAAEVYGVVGYGSAISWPQYRDTSGRVSDIPLNDGDTIAVLAK